ncbi:MAG TPA: thiolase [Stellaceae bacterium]|nr:thiolase [Stellaceae bacterium]
MAHALRGAAAIIGTGTAGFGEAPGRTHLELLAEAAHKALEDAGIGLDDVDGVYTATALNFSPGLTVPEYLGIQPAIVDGTNVGGSSFLQHVISATMALQAGLCKVALICYGSNQRSASGRLTSMSDPPPYEVLYKPRMPLTAYALAASRHIHQYGTTVEQLAEVAVAARGWASLNPDAFMREPLTVAEVRAARMVCDPFTVRDCCLVTDGAGALVMVAADRAKVSAKKPVYFLGGGFATTHRQISSMPDLTVTGAAQSGPRAFAMAGLSPQEVDVLELYDAFTINTILFLEDLGYCKKGEGGAFVAGGRIAPGGALPVNTNGGGLSCVHPGMYGIFTLIEGATQLRGEAGARQVRGAEIALCHGNGGTLSSQVTVLLGGAAAV